MAKAKSNVALNAAIDALDDDIGDVKVRADILAQFWREKAVGDPVDRTELDVIAQTIRDLQGLGVRLQRRFDGLYRIAVGAGR